MLAVNSDGSWWCISTTEYYHYYILLYTTMYYYCITIRAKPPGNECSRVAYEWLVNNSWASSCKIFTCNSWAACKQSSSNTQVTRVLDMHVCVSDLQLRGDWQVKCYTDKCGVNRNFRATHQQKSEQLVDKM